MDKVYLKNGEELHGRMTNEELTFHTAYGGLSFNVDWLTEIRFDTKDHLDRFDTRHRNRLSGFCHDTIRFETDAGETLELDKNRLDRIHLHRRASSITPDSTGRFLILANGDFLSGQWRNWNDFMRPGLVSKVDGLEAVEVIHFAQAANTLQILLRNGDEASASLNQELVSFQLDLGPVLQVPVSHIESLHARNGTVPPTVQRAFAGPGDIETSLFRSPPVPNPDGMVWIPPGRFLMGSYPVEKGHGQDEDPPTEMVITYGFWMGRYEVTQAEYEAVMGVNPSGFLGAANHPVEKVTWNEANAYCAKRTQRERDLGTLPMGYVYRLPTEAEWEYACRAGSDTRFSFGDDLDETRLSSFAWYIRNSDASSHPVGELEPNAWGLYDMHGNVWEWCQDLWQEAYPGGTVTNYVGSTEGWLRVARGGSWLYDASFCRSANRDNYGPSNRCSDIGFRVVLAPER